MSYSELISENIKTIPDKMLMLIFDHTLNKLDNAYINNIGLYYKLENYYELIKGEMLNRSRRISAN